MDTGTVNECTAQLVAEVVVPDLPPVLAFYRALGFRVERETPAFVVLRWAESYLFLAQDPLATVQPRWTNVRVVVPDVDVVWARMLALGVSVINPIGDRSYGLRDFTLRDPAGFEVRFAQPI